MESNVALLRAASGLERLMVHNKNMGIMKDSNVVQISAALYYKANVIAGLESNSAFKNKFKQMIFGQIEKDFGNYVDAKARVRPKSLHHVYEWRKTGQQSGRLFKLYMIPSNTLSFQLDYNLLPSRTFVSNKVSKKSYKFVEKAYIVESGTPVTISPRSSKRLVFKSGDSFVFMPEGASVTVRNPGGRAAKNQFKLAYSHFFSGSLVSSSFKKSGFTRLFSGAMAEALSVPANIRRIQFSYSPNQIRTEAEMALSKAFGGGIA